MENVRPSVKTRSNVDQNIVKQGQQSCDFKDTDLKQYFVILSLSLRELKKG
jgi:hypothetical protein